MANIRIILIYGQEFNHNGAQVLKELQEEIAQGMLEAEDAMEIVGGYSSAEEALCQPETLSPDVVIIDAGTSYMEKTELTPRLHQKWASCKVIILTCCEDCLTEALKSEVAGYLLKDINCRELALAVRRAYHGELIIDERLSSTPQALEEESEGDDSDGIFREIELVIPPPAESARLLRFICQLEEVLGATIVHEIGSWKNGIAITIALQRTVTTTVVLDRLENMPEVEGVKQMPEGRYNPFNVPRKIMTNSGTRPEKQLLVTLKQTGIARQMELAGL